MTLIENHLVITTIYAVKFYKILEEVLGQRGKERLKKYTFFQKKIAIVEKIAKIYGIKLANTIPLPAKMFSNFYQTLEEAPWLLEKKPQKLFEFMLAILTHRLTKR